VECQRMLNGSALRNSEKAVAGDREREG